MYHRCRRWHKVATPIKITPFSRLKRGFFFFFFFLSTRISKGNVLITRILFQANWATMLLSKKRIAITFSVSMRLSTRVHAKIINTFLQTQVYVAIEICDASMKRKKRVLRVDFNRAVIIVISNILSLLPPVNVSTFNSKSLKDDW